MKLTKYRRESRASERIAQALESRIEAHKSSTQRLSELSDLYLKKHELLSSHTREETLKAMDEANLKIMAEDHPGAIDQSDRQIAKIQSELAERDKKDKELTDKLTDLIQRSKVFSPWMAEAKKIETVSEAMLLELKENKYVDPVLIDKDLETIGTMTYYQPPITITIASDHGGFREGSWCTLGIDVTNHGKCPISMKAIRLTNDFMIKNVDLSQIDAESKALIEVGINPKISGTIPVPISIDYVLPWEKADSEPHTVNDKIVMTIKGAAKEAPPELKPIPPPPPPPMPTKCPGCGRDVKPAWLKCPYCRKPLK